MTGSNEIQRYTVSNIAGYVILAGIGVGVTFYSIYIKRNIYKVSTLVMFYLFVAGATWIGEFIVLGLFNSYAYKTGIFVNPWAQNLLGHLILNTTLYPAMAIVVVAYSFRFGGMCSIAVIILGMEYLFLKLGLYEHHWWRYYMTALTVLLLLIISKYWFAKLLQKPYGSTRAVTFYFIAMVIIHIPAPILLLLGKQHYQTALTDRLSKDFYLSSVIFIFFYHLILSFIFVLLTCVLKKWYWKAVPFIFPITVQSLLARIGILKIADGWKLIYTILVYEAFIALFVLLEKTTLKPEPDRAYLRETD